jgi:acetyl-CoA acyltransferase
MNAKSRRAVIVAGARTPFVRSFGTLIDLDAIELGNAAVKGLLARTGLPAREVDGIVWGGVVLPPAAPNVGREIALDLGMPPEVEAMTVTRACATGLQAVVLAAAAIERGEADVMIAGGGDSTSNASLTMPPSFIRKVGPVAMSSKSGVSDYFRALGKLSPLEDLVPRKPAIAERTTGEVMGEAAERMAERNQIAREDQDAFAVRSHHRAAAAVEAGRFDEEIVPVDGPRGERILRDELIRAERLARLRPAFKKDGTLTAGNSSALTDGAASVLLMSLEKARALGFTPLAAFRSWSFIGVDPADQLLMGPAIAMPKALARAGMTMADADLFDIHEAFAAQVLSVLKMLGSEAFGKQRLGLSGAAGEIDPEVLNVRGGSIALGHPFAATGARMVTTMANELHQGNHETAVLGICAAGGLGAAAVMEAV